jgi:hypothetical protein
MKLDKTDYWASPNVVHARTTNAIIFKVMIYAIGIPPPHHDRLLSPQLFLKGT